LARFVKVSQQELDSIRKLYESVMSYACHGLFFREGMVLAEEVTKNLALGDDPLEFGRKVILERGWAEEVSFTDSGARVRGSIEAMPGGDVETCHRLRGILSKLLEAKTKHRVRLAEVECVSTGGRECVFEREGGALREVTKAEAVAVVNRDGGIVAAELPRNVSQETFSIMCAAILGAGMTAATELGHTAPHRVLLESDDATVVIQEIGRRAMVVLVVPPERVVSDLDAAISRFAQAAAKDLD